jgi:hypothetical protein
MITTHATAPPSTKRMVTLLYSSAQLPYRFTITPSLIHMDSRLLNRTVPLHPTPGNIQACLNTLDPSFHQQAFSHNLRSNNKLNSALTDSNFRRKFLFHLRPPPAVLKPKRIVHTTTTQRHFYCSATSVLIRTTRHIQRWRRLKKRRRRRRRMMTP